MPRYMYPHLVKKTSTKSKYTMMMCIFIMPLVFHSYRMWGLWTPKLTPPRVFFLLFWAQETPPKTPRMTGGFWKTGSWYKISIWVILDDFLELPPLTILECLWKVPANVCFFVFFRGKSRKLAHETPISCWMISLIADPTMSQSKGSIYHLFAHLFPACLWVRTGLDG